MPAFLTTETFLPRPSTPIRVIHVTLPIIGKRPFDRRLDEAIDTGLAQLQAQANQLGADAVIAITITTTTQLTDPLLVTVLGTAVKF